MARGALKIGLVLTACLNLAVCCAPPQPTSTPMPTSTPVPPTATPSATPTRSHEELTERTGFIRELGASIFMQGTHKLVDDQGELICLLSGRQNGVDLNKAMDQGKVNVYGTLAPTVEGNAQIMEVQLIEPIK